MIDPHLGTLLPFRWRMPQKAAKYDQHIIVNWLQIEVDPDAPRRMPTLDKLRGWRNVEVFYFIRDGWDWTARACS